MCVFVYVNHLEQWLHNYCIHEMVVMAFFTRYPCKIVHSHTKQPFAIVWSEITYVESRVILAHIVKYLLC